MRGACHLHDRRVDLVIPHRILRPGAAGQRARAKADDGKTHRAIEARPHRLERLRDGGAVPIIKQRLGRGCGFAIGLADALTAVQRGTVLKQPKLAVRSVKDSADPEEAAHRDGAVLFDDAVVDEERERNHRGECQRDAPQQHG